MRQCRGPAFDVVPAIDGRQWDNNMQAFAARAFEKAFKPDLSEPCSDFKRGLLDLRERDDRIGIQIEDHSVRRMNGIDSGTPWVYLDDAHLDHLHDSFDVLDINIFVTPAFIRPRKRMDIWT